EFMPICPHGKQRPQKPRSKKAQKANSENSPAAKGSAPSPRAGCPQTNRKSIASTPANEPYLRPQSPSYAYGVRRLAAALTAKTPPPTECPPRRRKCSAAPWSAAAQLLLLQLQLNHPNKSQPQRTVVCNHLPQPTDRSHRRQNEISPNRNISPSRNLRHRHPGSNGPAIPRNPGSKLV